MGRNILACTNLSLSLSLILFQKNHQVITTDESLTEPTPVQPQDAVVVDFVGRAASTKDDEDGPIFQEAKDWLVVIGEKDVLPALEMGIRFMQVGQTALVWSHCKFAYGPTTRQHGDYELPADSSVIYRVTVKSVVNSDRIVDDPAFQLQVASSKKKIGNDAYANEWSDGHGKSRAKLLYKRAADMMEYLLHTVQDDVDKKKQAFEIMMDCLNNIAAIHLRAKEFHSAKEAAVKVLMHDPDNLKGLIRAAKASLLDPASSYEEVEMAVEAAETNHPDDAEVRKLRMDLKQRKQAYKKKTKELFSKLGGKSLKKDESIESKAVAEEENAVSSTDVEPAEEPPTPWWRKNWRQWEWWNIILPYGFQLTLPLVTYYIYTVMKAKEVVILESMRTDAAAAAHTSSQDEFGGMPGGSEF